MTKNLAIMIGLVAGLALGLAASLSGNARLGDFVTGVVPIGTAFINLIRLAVVPVVATALFSGVAGLGNARRLGRLGGWTLAFVWVTTLAAIGIGMLVTTVALRLSHTPPMALPPSDVVPPTVPGLGEFLVSLIPANAIAAAADGALLPLIVFSALFGAAAGALPEAQKRPLLDLAQAITAALIKLVHWILWTAPLGVFALAAPAAAGTGFGLLRNLAVFLIAVLLGLVIFTALVYLPAVRWAGMPLRRFWRAAPPPAAIAFTTTSSVATLPALFEACERELGQPRGLTSFVLPLATSLNRAGSALYQGCAVVFLAHLAGRSVGLAGAGGALLATFLIALSIAPVPSASVMTLPPALTAVGAPLDGLGVLLGIDRIPDMFRTVVNVVGDLVACLVVGRAAPPRDAG